MRSLGAVGVLCVAVVPAMAGGKAYVFDVVSGTVMMDVSPDGIVSPDPTIVQGDGTFGMTIYQNGAHIGQSDYFLLGDSSIFNSETVSLSLVGLVGATLPAGSAEFAGFQMDEPAHIGPGGAATVLTDVTVAGTVFVTGIMETTFFAGVTDPDASLNVTFTTSAAQSDVVTVTLGGTFTYQYGISEVGQTITLDLVVAVTGTAHVVPGPALGGLTLLGLGGAGAWLRRRRGG